MLCHPQTRLRIDHVRVLILLLLLLLLLLGLVGIVVLLLIILAPVLGVVVLVLAFVALVVANPVPYFPLIPVKMDESERASENVEITVPVQKTQDKKTKELFENKVSNSMDFIRRYAGGGKTNFLILPKKEDDKQSQHIRDRSQFPNHQILWRSMYMQMDSNYYFSPMTERNKKRNIRASMWVGANEDIASIIDEISGDLQSDEGVVVRIKGVQQLKTCSDYCILGLPIAFSTQQVIDVTNSVINKVENKIKKDPIEFNVHVAYPYGMPFINRDSSKPFEENGRRAFIF